jgi:amino acid transporter, AAT family
VLLTQGLLDSANLITVKVFGEIEFWFVLIKVATIIAVVVIGLTIILFKFGDLRETASFSNLWTQGGFLPFGALGVFLSMPDGYVHLSRFGTDRRLRWRNREPGAGASPCGQ